jgi:hypothetical protein
MALRRWSSPRFVARRSEQHPVYAVKCHVLSANDYMSRPG